MTSDTEIKRRVARWRNWPPLYLLALVALLPLLAVLLLLKGCMLLTRIARA